MGKDFDRWNEKKKKIDASGRDGNFFFYEREIWWCAIGANVGVETDGKHDYFERPVLVVKKFNKEMFWGVPLSSRARFGRYYTKISHSSGDSWVMLSQLKTVSSKRLVRKFETISFDDLERVKGSLRGMLKNEIPR